MNIALSTPEFIDKAKQDFDAITAGLATSIGTKGIVVRHSERLSDMDSLRLD